VHGGPLHLRQRRRALLRDVGFPDRDRLLEL
jgi:hypothetical protein